MWTFCWIFCCARCLHILLWVILSWVVSLRKLSLHANKIGIIFTWNRLCIGKEEQLSIFILYIEKNNKCTHGLTDKYRRTVIHWHSPNHVNIIMCHFNLTSEVVYHGATWVFFKPKLGKIKKSTPEQNSYFSENGTFLTQKNLIKLF